MGLLKGLRRLREVGHQPPHLRPATGDGQNCHTCEFMGAHGQCDKYHWPVKPDEVCDSWVAKMREASYELPDGRAVWYDDDRVTQDAADLYTVLEELYGTGSPNLENAQAREILTALQSGNGLSEVYIGTLRQLLNKHQQKIDLLRRQKDRAGQDLLQVASPGPESRMIQPNERY